MSTQQSYIVDHSPRWQIGYCKSAAHSGKYHLMLTDKVHLFNTDRPAWEISSRTVGYYAKKEITSIVAFLLDQPTEVLNAVWHSGT